jgi:ABC-2 type transport system permease protein
MNTVTVKSFKALIKREYWEHRGAMFLTPAIMAAVFAGLLILSAFGNDIDITNNGETFSPWDHLPRAVDAFEKLDDNERSRGVQIGLYAPIVLFGFVMLIISLFYALGSLYDERKDRSILFWKSLPISDTSTVLSKFVSVIILIPILYFAITVAFQLFLLLFTTVGAWFGGSSGVTIWASSNLFEVLFNSLFSMIVASLWLAPIWSWLMLASSWANKVAFLWGTLPIFMISVAEGWVFHSSHFIEMIGKRIANGFTILNSNMHFLAGGDMFDVHVMHWYEVFANVEFWAGLMVSAAFLAGAIYTRRHRDES